MGDLGLIAGLGKSPGEGNSYPLQYSGLQNSMDCIVHGVAKSLNRLSDFDSVTCFIEGSYLLSILHLVVCVHQSYSSQFISPSASFLGAHTFVPHVCVSIPALQIGSSVPSFLDFTFMH